MSAAERTTKILGSSQDDDAPGTPDCLTGRLLSGRFLVREVIGRGGTSTVYRGWHRDLHCPVAIKVLNATVAADRSLNRYFLREAMVTARLSSPHAVRVYDRGLLEDGAPYTVMEYLEGETLEELLGRVGKLPATVAVDLALQVCALLTEAHGQSIAHCDIKPDNLFLFRFPDRRSLLKVLDFGTARGKHTPPYVWTSCVGTPGYMAPEQIQSPGQVDHRADIWAVGVILYQMVSGQLPFSGLSPCERMAATVRRTPPPLENLAPGLPGRFYQLVRRCLEKDPAQRPATVRGVTAELTKLRRSLRAKLEPESTRTRLEPESARAKLAPESSRTTRDADSETRKRPSSSGATSRVHRLRAAVFGRLVSYRGAQWLKKALRRSIEPLQRAFTLKAPARLIGGCLLLACAGAYLGTLVPSRWVRDGTSWLSASLGAGSVSPRSR